MILSNKKLYGEVKCTWVHSLFRMHRPCTCNRETGPIATMELVATERLGQLQLDGTDCNWTELIATRTEPVATTRELVATRFELVATGRIPVATRGWVHSVYKMHPGAL